MRPAQLAGRFPDQGYGNFTYPSPGSNLKPVVWCPPTEICPPNGNKFEPCKPHCPPDQPICPPPSPSVSNSIFVDGTFGNDSTAQAYNPGLPFKSIPAAVNASKTGDSLQISSGTYLVSQNILKDGVNLLLTPTTNIVATAAGILSGTITQNTQIIGGNIMDNTGGGTDPVININGPLTFDVDAKMRTKNTNRRTNKAMPFAPPTGHVGLVIDVNQIINQSPMNFSNVQLLLRVKLLQSSNTISFSNTYVSASINEGLFQGSNIALNVDNSSFYYESDYVYNNTPNLLYNSNNKYFNFLVKTLVSDFITGELFNMNSGLDYNSPAFILIDVCECNNVFLVCGFKYELHVQIYNYTYVNTANDSNLFVINNGISTEVSDLYFNGTYTIPNFQISGPYAYTDGSVIIRGNPVISGFNFRNFGAMGFPSGSTVSSTLNPSLIFTNVPSP